MDCPCQSDAPVHAALAALNIGWRSAAVSERRPTFLSQSASSPPDWRLSAPPGSCADRRTTRATTVRARAIVGHQTSDCRTQHAAPTSRTTCRLSTCRLSADLQIVDCQTADCQNVGSVLGYRHGAGATVESGVGVVPTPLSTSARPEVERAIGEGNLTVESGVGVVPTSLSTGGITCCWSTWP